MTEIENIFPFCNFFADLLGTPLHAFRDSSVYQYRSDRRVFIKKRRIMYTSKRECSQLKLIRRKNYCFTIICNVYLAGAITQTFKPQVAYYITKKPMFFDVILHFERDERRSYLYLCAFQRYCVCVRDDVILLLLFYENIWAVLCSIGYSVDT